MFNVKKFILLLILFNLFFNNSVRADFQENLIKKYITINTLLFNFTQKLGDKTEIGQCYIKYPLLMRCEYPKKKKDYNRRWKKICYNKKKI